MKVKRVYWFAVAVGIIIIGWVALQWDRTPIEAPAVSGKPARNLLRTGRIRPSGGEGEPAAGQGSAAAHKKAEAPAKAPDEETAREDAPESLTEEERREQEEEKQVDAFDALTDKWMEPAKDGVAMKDIDAFVAQFKKVPKSRKEECLQRALNLVPDENIMLLAGILMDKEEDKELVELVFNDVLNRDDEMKQVLLNQIYKDKSHPCWADAAWILDVTGKVDAGSGETVKDEAGKDGE